MIFQQRGSITVLSIVFTAALLVLSTGYMSLTVQEKNLMGKVVFAKKATAAAEAGANDGLYGLDLLVNTYLFNTINSLTASVVSTAAAGYVSSGNGLPLLLSYVKNGTTALLTQQGTEAVYSTTTTAIDGGTYQYTIRLSQKSAPVVVAANIWQFAYFYKIHSTGTHSGVGKKMTLHGDFTIRIQKDNFARYALFTNSQTSPAGSNVWFTSMTNFAGPVFTNGRFNFAYNPSGAFYDLIRQHEVTARFHNNNSPILLDSDHNGTRDVPSFFGGFTRNANTVAMPSTAVQTSMASEASGGNTYSSNGIYVPASGGALTGGIYVYGDATVGMSVDGSSRQVLTITRGSTTKTVTMDRTANQTIVTSGGVPTTYNGLPDGVSNAGPVVYVRGNITSFSGQVQRDTNMTVASRNDITITNNIMYQNFTVGSGTPGDAGYVPPTAQGAGNALGILSWEGNVNISTSAPSDINVHGVVMAKTGVFQVNNHDSIAAKGTATVLGGVISDNYGAFGTFNSSTGEHITGYGRNFVYDQRMEFDITPPYFPTMNTFIAFTNDIDDKMFWQKGGF